MEQVAAPCRHRRIVLGNLRKAGLSLSSIRVLVVEDFEPFRRFVVSTLQTAPGLRLISEASDGLEAVQKVEELRPDLVVLDIGLPTLNGLEAARRIRKVSPKSKILFLSQESSADIVQEALGLGASGYVVKAMAGTELLPAVKAVVRGKQFVSDGLSTSDLEGQDSEHQFYHPEVLPFPAPKTEARAYRHEVAYYSDDAALVAAFVVFIEAALRKGRPVIALVTEPHRQSLLQNLRSLGVDTAASIEQGNLILADVFEALAGFMVNGQPDRDRFAKCADDLIAAALKAAQGRRVKIAACGECAPTLLAQGVADGAIELEHLWDEVARRHNIDILCGYLRSTAARDYDTSTFRRIDAEHSLVHSF